jgi:hypothetical protein
VAPHITGITTAFCIGAQICRDVQQQSAITHKSCFCSGHERIYEYSLA